jgi:hypothetical protein
MVRSATKGAAMSTQEIGIRFLDQRDGEELRRLAERDSAPAPTGLVIGATVNGRLTAALSLSSGAEVADPFAPTSQLRALLADRAEQLRGGAGPRGPVSWLRHRRRARAALPASPPGAGGRLLEI